MTVRRIALGADHAGFDLKERIKRVIAARGLECQDLGTDSTTSVDYPDYAERVAREVARGRADRGILVCGTGTGMAMAANKVAGIRAAACPTLDVARLAREHNDANVLALGARMIGADLATDIVRLFLDTAFAGGRHVSRIEKLARLEGSSHGP